MSRKRTKREKRAKERSPELKPERPRAKSRSELILAIVATDSTFKRVLPEYPGQRMPYWAGRCIHCRTRVCVLDDGSTNSTVEHIRPLCNGGSPDDPRNLALACFGCNNEKGIRHDRFAGRDGRADEVIAALLEKRMERWRDLERPTA